MTKQTLRYLALAGASMAVLGAATSVYAADASTSISEVVVVGEKHSTTLQKAPLAISAISADTLSKKDITSIVGLNGYVPGLAVVENGPRISAITIRGVGYDSDNISTSPGVSFHVDGIYLAAPFATSAQFLDVERVEVLRGPQGAVFGQASTGGAVNLISHRPVIGQYSGDASLSYGTYNLVKSNAAVNIPISDQFAGRLAIETDRHDGFAKEIYVAGRPQYKLDEANNVGAKGSLLWEPTSTLSVVLTGQDYYSDTHGAALKGVNDPNPNPRVISQDLPSNLSVNLILASADVKWELPFATFDAVSGYQKGTNRSVTDNDRLAYQIKPFYDDLYTNANNTTFTEDVTLSSKSGGPLDWIVGVSYMNERYGSYTYEFQGKDANPTFFFPTSKLNLPYNFNYSVFTSYLRQNVAGFAQATYKIRPWLRVTGGFRYTAESLNEVTNTDLLEFAPLTKTNLSDSQPTGKFEVDADVVPTSMVYASFSRGFKPGGVNLNNTNILAPHTFLPETVSAVEVGSKNRFFQNRLTLNVSAFYYDDQNYQYQEEDPIPYQGGVSNVPDAHIYGVEAEGSYSITDDLTLSGNLTRLGGQFDGAYKTLDPSLAASVRRAAAAAGHSAYSGYTIGALIGSTLNTNGNTVPNIPDWEGSLSLDHILRLNAGALKSEVSVTYRGAMVDRIFNQAALDHVPSYDIWNLNFQFTPNNSKWTFLLTATNLFDNAGIVSRYSNPFGSFTTDSQYVPPRQVFGTVKYTF